ncbi:MAG: beta-N-acetylhexosaminidase, partial [Burkholderiaceae bacterium]
ATRSVSVGFGRAAALLNALGQARHARQHRRLALLPARAPQPWDDLMREPAYRHALGLIP